MTESAISQPNPNLTWIDTFLGVLVAPRSTFARLREENRESLHGFAGAMVLLALVFALDGLRFSTVSSIKWAAVNLPSAIIMGGSYWLCLAAAVALGAICFGAPKYRVRAVMINLAWSFVPWLFMGPIGCFRNVLGPAISMMVCLAMLWVFILQLIAINESFEMKSWQTLALVFVLPGLLCWVQICQLLQGIYIFMEPLNG